MLYSRYVSTVGGAEIVIARKTAIRGHGLAVHQIEIAEIDIGQVGGVPVSLPVAYSRSRREMITGGQQTDIAGFRCPQGEGDQVLFQLGRVLWRTAGH